MPSPGRWALLDIQQTRTDLGFDIVVTTDVPCHLWMRWSNVKPQEHMRPVLRRGLYLHSEKYYCFDVYEDNQQQEPGDTTTHTFVKEYWEACETRWFYFHGNLDEVQSPSTGPIFEKHRPPPDYGAETTVDFPSHPYDAYLLQYGAVNAETYTTYWLKPTATLNTTAGVIAAWNKGGTTSVQIRRVILVFDTTTLPWDAIIKAITLRLTSTDRGNPRDASLCLTPATFCHLPVRDTDYYFLRVSPTPLVRWKFTALPDDTPVNLPLPETVFKHISKTALTKLGLRISYEINADPCTIGNEYNNIASCQHPTPGWRPQLTITYLPPI